MNVRWNEGSKAGNPDLSRVFGTKRQYFLIVRKIHEFFGLCLAAAISTHSHTAGDIFTLTNYEVISIWI
jgi:hypothetical protein